LANSEKETNPVSTATHFCIARGLLLLRDQIPSPPIILFRSNQHLLCELAKKNFAAYIVRCYLCLLEKEIYCAKLFAALGGSGGEVWML
jgi:hypothetical protein